ncbi:MAG: biotin synthase BioB [Nitrospirae bacterium CG_4_9_14_3_um_filter_53_35]|nr:MAG: biotin synthase BioB [Nitrospirae bacterium CG2_30_53_67]PIS36689.1 MAG: biotin synthase BioB [Nitrospirae bacterium CG08_land_8_20_14_0_20_52_24]PIV82498.1 MAG: biotin synthase BioB [Nitrospirae bacterium CG17_big_fil_post_rev_8_21_14_2_50_50_9]PIW85171.1 MAG: biotin synthase BioB [Nitrospirae bacterium CG_4_8_14_3_um_filter_50_41]PIX86823.1 MAG: biotin synthase BioB [Nitrospirae bacterium CG_4_10_14_3_um_filter_53_41]PJA75248.1 MAG: biotin synthase BioB [Nitrospirae bacterium CG_4_9_
MHAEIKAVLKGVLDRDPLTREQALMLAETPPQDLPEILNAARRVRETHRGDVVSLCAIINAKSGRCSEDCRFCAQSLRYQTGVKAYPLIPDQRILDGWERSAQDGVSFFCIVTSGRRAEPDELERIRGVLQRMREAGKVRPCASLGALNLEDLVGLREAGLVRYHHNIETARSFYASVCTTHSYDERVRTVLNAGKAGLQVCSGGILGMGETMAQRVEMAMALRDLQVDSIPLNFLNPIPGTPLAGKGILARDEILKTVALFRLINPDREIRACAGREVHLGEEQGMLFDAGVDGILTGDYLTTKGTPPGKDREVILSHGLRVAPDA